MPEAPAPKPGKSTDWDSLLTDFEADLHAALAPEPDTDRIPISGPWTAPQDLGALPARLADRADRILRAQRQALIALEHEKDETAKHLAALGAIPSVRPPLQSVYLDVEG